MFRFLSSVIYPQILLLLGLIFINTALGASVSGPSNRFADKLETVPTLEFYDILKVEEEIWLAGNGLFTISGENFETVFSDERVTALALDGDGDRLWFAASGKIGNFDFHSDERGFIPVGSSFIWSLVKSRGKLWYFGSDNYGWIDPDTLTIGAAWTESFSPRPVVIHDDSLTERIFVGAGKGLWEVTESGRELVMPKSQTGEGLIAWLESDGGSYLLGTSENIYRWSGVAGDAATQLNSNYGEFFRKGINNSVGFSDHIAITDYPLGVALWDRKEERISGYIPSDEMLDVGDVFKIDVMDRDGLVLLGTGGVGVADLSSESRVFSNNQLFGDGKYRKGVINEDGAILFTETAWVKIDEKGFIQNILPRTASWACLDLDGQPIYGAVNAFERLEDGEWVTTVLEKPIIDYISGQSGGYSLGIDGIYAVDAELSSTLIHGTDDQVQLIGEYKGSLYFLDGSGGLNRLIDGDEGWALENLDYVFDDTIEGFDVSTSGVWLATESVVYHVDEGGMEAYPSAPGWNVAGLEATIGQTTVLYLNPVNRQLAVGVFGPLGSVMLSVPHLEGLGEPLDVLRNSTRIGIVGTVGVGWYAINELERVVAPEVDFDLLVEDKRIEDRTIPSGMHFIDLQVSFANPTIPSQVQYRINEQRWRNVNLQDPTMQFAGHGNFTVELRAMHPNGTASPLRVVQFGISPPWYLNPIYQVVMLVLAMIGMWGLYYLRSAQLKRTNLWLQREVRKQTRELEAATAARTNFLAGLSHDIRNPLNGVLMIAETLTRQPPTSGDDPRLQDLTQFGIMVDRMLGEILDFSAIDQENIPTAFIPVSITDIINSTIKQNQFGIQHEMVLINTVIPDELKDVVIRTDRNWMIKIISNLLINALEYAGSERIEVGAVCHRISDTEVEMELYVSDWGGGIDDSEKEFVFERFYRGESGIESGKHGTGLGLSICQEIAHAMGAHLRLEDNEPSGCRFVLKGKFDRIEGERELDTEVVLDSLRGKKILVVDDLVYNRRSIVDFFETIGCECDQAENGRKALEKLDANRYHLALLDWDLPGLTGPEIARRHRRTVPDDPVILISVTAYTDGEKKRESEEAGMNGYISKPLTAIRLAHCLANIEDWKPRKDESSDIIDSDEVEEEIYSHIEECLLYGEQYEWENLRRCAHRLTTLALIRNNKAMQQVCRDIQVSAENGDIKESQSLLLELHQWRR